jgi:hypothetical protein
MLLLFWGASALSTAAPSITLSLAPLAAATKRAQASPGIVLALTPVARQTHMAQASPSIRLALDAAGGSVIELEYNAAGSLVTGSQEITFREGGVSTLTLSKTE